jgi:hypothetical protein
MKTTKDQFKDTIQKVFSEKGVYSQGEEGVKSANQMINAIKETEETIIKRPIKTGMTKKSTGNKKMKLPIGKMTTMRGKSEPKEATGSGSSGGYSQPLFTTKPKRLDSMFKDEQPKKKVKGGFVYENKEKLKGGLADNKTFKDLVDRYKQKGKDIGLVEKELKSQLNKGIKVEMEHTDDRGKAKEIAMDHLFEDPKYYDKLQKIETKEATGSGSSGSYETTSVWAKSMNKKDFRGASKPQIPGGKFVQVKKKCKTFPYCNQGDIKSLKIYENKLVKQVISNITKKYNIEESVIKTIIQNQLENNGIILK